MGVIWTSKTRTRQPTSVVGINRASPISNGLQIAWAGSTPLVNQATGRVSIELINAPRVVATPYGVGVELNGSNQSVNLNAKLGTASGSWYALAYNGSSLNGSSGILSQSTDDAGNGISVGTYQGYVKGGSTQAYIFDSGSTETLKAVGGTWGSATKAYKLGILQDTAGAGGTPSNPSGNYYAHLGAFHYNGGRLFHWGGTPVVFFYFDRQLSDAEMLEIHRNPWQLFAPEKRPLFFSTGGGANTTGTLAVTLDAATLTGIGGVARSGTLATTLDAATLTGVGNVTRSGTLAVTLDAATLTGTGAVTRSGALNSTLDAVTLAGVGSVAVGTSRDGALAVTLDAATLAGTGAVTTSGTLAVTLDNVTLAGIGTAGQAVTGTLGVTLGNVTLAGIGAIPAAPSAGGGKTFGSNKKKKKQRKAIESEEWLKAEETAKQLLQDRFTKTTPEAKLEALASHIESLQPVIEALKALAREDVHEAVQETKTEELTEHQQVLNKFDALITKMSSIEELLIIMMAQ